MELQLNLFDYNPREIYQPPKKPWTPKCSNQFLVNLNGCELPPLSELRITPKGEKTVAQLVKVGDVVKTSYGTGPYNVKEIKCYEEYGYPPCYSLILTDINGRGQYWINELVAVGGRLLHLFKANKDEVFIEG